VKNRAILAGEAGANETTGRAIGGDAVGTLIQLLKNALADRTYRLLQFVAAAELIEADLWQQYAELGGLPKAAAANPYQVAFQQLDGDGNQYITSNTLDEASHAEFLNAYLISKGQQPVNLDQFRTLPSSQASGARQIGRLTNLMQLTVDTSWYVRYRSATNPDFGATYPHAIRLQDPNLDHARRPSSPCWRSFENV
jgi:hypothetical protein